MRHGRTFSVAVGLLIVGAIASTFKDEGLPDPTAAVAQSAPSQHFQMPDPANLTKAEAEAIYQQLSPQMRDGYAVSGLDAARDYLGWTRFNTSSYPSTQHGDRLLNNYVNPKGEDYGLYEASDPLPVGTIIAKDSFSVASDGEAFAGPLFLMEKMPPGFEPAAADWRYTMILPDGSVLGVTGGESDSNVRFCVECHAAGAPETDHLFFVPTDYRW